GNSGAAALRQTIQWQHNGKLFSILSQGSEYQPPLKRDGNKEQTAQARPIAINRRLSFFYFFFTTLPEPRRYARYRPTLVIRGSHGRRNHTDQMQTSVNGTDNRAQEDEMMAGDDPYNPYKSTDQDNPYYNYYDTYERPRPAPRPGYGTRYFQY
ncbi:hypothetical protein M9458_021617, partial [Cirrhinus mrigala]